LLALHYHTVGSTVRTIANSSLYSFLHDTMDCCQLASIDGTVKGKEVPLQAWSGSEGSRKLRFSDFTTMAQDGGKIVSLRHWPPLPLGNTPGTHFW
jgi:hypothetical protein